MQKLAIIGFGRFGQLLAELTKDNFEVSVMEPDKAKQQLAIGRGLTVIPPEAIGQVEFICLAVPISSIESVIKQIAPRLSRKHVVIDICSVKVYPATLIKQHLAHCQTIASHPLFGPDSAKQGLQDAKLVLCRLDVTDKNFELWRSFWQRLGVTVIEATPEEHDADSVYSQAFTYSIAHIILETGVPDLRFTTRSFNKIKEVAALSANDTDQLFHDMLCYNPYFPEMRARLESAAANVLQQLDAIENEAKVKKLA